MQEALSAYPPRPQPPAYLLDAYHPALYVGSGQQAPLEVSTLLAERFPILLAGGLTPENVSAVVEKVRPCRVDTDSDVELEPGKKDPVRLRAFIRAVRDSCSRLPLQ